MGWGGGGWSSDHPGPVDAVVERVNPDTPRCGVGGVNTQWPECPVANYMKCITVNLTPHLMHNKALTFM